MLALLIGAVFTFAFGGLLLILVLGAQRIQDELKDREREVRAICEPAARGPRFLVVGQPAAPRVTQIDERLLWQVRQYVEAEETLADEFVRQPSMESLYRDSGRRITTH